MWSMKGNSVAWQELIKLSQPCPRRVQAVLHCATIFQTFGNVLAGKPRHGQSGLTLACLPTQTLVVELGQEIEPPVSLLGTP